MRMSIAAALPLVGCRRLLYHSSGANFWQGRISIFPGYDGSCTGCFPALSCGARPAFTTSRCQLSSGAAVSGENKEASTTSQEEEASRRNFRLFISALGNYDDRVAASLMAALRKQLDGNITFCGVGGVAMADNGLESIVAPETSSQMASAEMVSKLPWLPGTLHQVRFCILHSVAAFQ